MKISEHLPKWGCQATILFVSSFSRVLMMILKLKKTFHGYFRQLKRLNCLKAKEPLQRGKLLFTTKSLGNPGTHLTDSEEWKAESTLESPSGFEPGIPGLGIHHSNQISYFICFLTRHCYQMEYLALFWLDMNEYVKELHLFHDRALMLCLLWKLFHKHMAAGEDRHFPCFYLIVHTKNYIVNMIQSDTVVFIVVFIATAGHICSSTCNFSCTCYWEQMVGGSVVEGLMFELFLIF